MNRFIEWLSTYDRKLFFTINHRMSHIILDKVLTRITHLGGAIFSSTLTLLIWILAAEPWSTVGLQSFVALVVSHIPVAILKRTLQRLRPYLALKGANTFPKPLTDHSFPSGHTTAIFAFTVPFMIAIPWLTFILLPLAMLVGISRIYLGLHYPSDVLAGAFVGTVAGIFTATVSLPFLS